MIRLKIKILSSLVLFVDLLNLMLLQEVHEVDLLARGEQVADCRLALIDVEKA